MRYPCPPPPWQRPLPLPLRNVAPRQPGATAPGQRPPRPWAGRWPALCGVRRSGWHRRSRAGERGAFPSSRPETGRKVVPCVAPPPWQRPSPLPHPHVATPCQPGAKAPGQRPPRPRRALLARRVGRWPSLRWVRGSLPHRSAGAGETRCVSLPPPGDGVGGGAMGCPAPWQRPSPLPRRNAAPPPAGGQSPRPAPAPPTAGASRPPGRALACVTLGETVFAALSRRGGGNAVRFLFPPRNGAEGGVMHPPSPRPTGKGHRLCHAATLPLRQPGAKAPGQRLPRPRRALLARRVGRWPALCVLRRSLPHRPARAGETRCVS
jgi:hypothetical protein